MYTTSVLPKSSTQMVEWWNNIDKVLLSGFFALCFIGFILVTSAGPAIAHRIGVADGFFSAQWWFVAKYVFFATTALIVMLIVSMMSDITIRRIGIVLFGIGIILLALTPFFGTEIKGARRWILGLQPSEIVKPGLVILMAWMMSLSRTREGFYGMFYAFLALTVTISLFIVQPDFGQTILVSSVWFAMFFSAGANLLWFIILGGVGVFGLIGGYYFLSHVRKRIDAFLSPDVLDKFGVNYQSDVAKKAFASGGVFGRGPGEGEVKNSLPDAHTDYIFSVAGEELGALVCLFIMGIYAFMVFRSMTKISNCYDYFSRFAVVGLMTLFGLQAFINMSVNVGLFPPKGMTLPFISYGGSSVIGLGFLAGFVLSLSRKR